MRKKQEKTRKRERVRGRKKAWERKRIRKGGKEGEKERDGNRLTLWQWYSLLNIFLYLSFSLSISLIFSLPLSLSRFFPFRLHLPMIEVLKLLTFLQKEELISSLHRLERERNKKWENFHTFKHIHTHTLSSLFSLFFLSLIIPHFLTNSLSFCL